MPKANREKPKKFKNYEIGYFHIDIAEVRSEQGKLCGVGPSRMSVPTSAVQAAE